MCGICGYISKDKTNIDQLIRMNNTMIHRGPDDSGAELFHTIDGYSVGLAHRRLAILDLSIAGHQPMKDVSERYIIVFNGEIYNYIDLRNNLEKKGYRFKSTSDTEVLLYHLIEYGEDGLKLLNGMFDFAFYDMEQSYLLLARDKIGEKPLYYFWDNETIVFGSELKPIMNYPNYKRIIRMESVNQFLVQNAIMPPYTIFENTFKLSSGECLVWNSGVVRKHKYYDIKEEFVKGKESPEEDYLVCKQKLKNHLYEAVSKRLVSDVPVGCFLSGGIDSTLVAAIANEVKPGGIDTFCIGFDDEKYNEATAAKASARYLGTKHHEKIMCEQDLVEMMNELVHYYDEPFSDSSQLATMLVSKFAKENVTVALSGDGGDELFAGYKKYDGFRLVEKARALTMPIRRIPLKRLVMVAEKYGIEKLSLLLQEDDDLALIQPKEFYREQIASRILRKKPIMKSTLLEYDGMSTYENLIERRMLHDLQYYMPNEVLVKTDRASMKYSLEMRTPLLDLGVVNYSFHIPFKYKYSKGEKKYILKDILYDFIPKEMMDRPKQGFGVPIRTWLNTILSDRLKRYSDKDVLEKQGIFDYEGIILLIDKVRKVEDYHTYSVLWSFFVFQEWYAKYIENMWG